MIRRNRYKFYMRRVTKDEYGCDIYGSEINLEYYFKGLRYKEMKGMDAYGKPHTYAETFADSNKSLVYVQEQPALEPTSIKLTLLFCDWEDNEDLLDARENISKDYHDFCAFVQGARIVYRDTGRQRKALMYLTEKTEPTTDRVSSNYYMEVTFTFANVYGKTFGYDEDFPDMEPMPAYEGLLETEDGNFIELEDSNTN